MERKKMCLPLFEYYFSKCCENKISKVIAVLCMFYLEFIPIVFKVVYANKCVLPVRTI